MKAQTTTILSAILLTVALSSASAFADSLKVSASDLDLTKPVDAATLYYRIAVSARKVCNAESSPWDGQKMKTRNRCIKAVIEDTVADINQPLLTTVHQDTIERVASL